LIPYNYINDTDVDVPTQDVFSGEAGVKVNKVTATVGTRYNGVTIADYATIVPDAKIKLFMYVTDADHKDEGGMVGGENGCELLTNKQCMEIESNSSFGALNPNGELDGGGPKTWLSGKTYNAYDASAGDYLCFVSALWPYSSAVDIQMDPHGDNMWKYSEAKCIVIKKKPSFQVWGDSMYSVGGVETNVAKKKNIYSSYFSSNTNLCKNGVCFDPYPGTSNATINLGSWVEEGLILRDGLTKTLASGAALGLNDKNYAKAGTTNASFCNAWSPLSFSNDCKNGVLGTESVGQSGIGSLVVDPRDELINYWIGSGTDVGACATSVVKGGACRKLESANNKNIYYVSGGNLTVSGGIPQNTTYLVKADNTVTINGNLTYNSGPYDHIGAIPKVIIYAQNRINIGCNVGEIDAILITAPGGRVDTCAGGGDENSPARDNQLKIFGTVMTDSITLGRTYGTAANETGSKTDHYGMPSDGAAAEIFDYDSTILMWSEFMSGSGESDTLNTTYQHELAPRY
jgi:hypothetical protein